MPDDIVAIIVAMLGAGGLGAIVQALAGRQKSGAEAGAVLTTQQREFSDDLLGMIRELRSRLDMAEARIAQLETVNLTLQQEIITLRSAAATSDARIRELTTERDQHRDEAERLAQIKAEQQARIVELEARVRDLEARLARVENGHGG